MVDSLLMSNTKEKLNTPQKRSTSPLPLPNTLPLLNTPLKLKRTPKIIPNILTPISLILMILSSPLNKKWNTALLSFPPILLFNYTSNFGCTIIIPHQSNLVDQESFLISYSFFEIIYLLLHLNYSHCEEILQSPYSLFLFILKKEIKKIKPNHSNSLLCERSELFSVLSQKIRAN